MKKTKNLLASLVLTSFMFPVMGHCGSVSLVSVSDSISASVEGISTSVGQISKSSSKAANLAEGEYRIIDVAEAADRPDRARLTLRAVGKDDAEEDFYLFMPKQEFARAQLQAGQTLAARNRPYGAAIFKQDLGEPIAVLLKDDWRSNLQPTPVTL